jgi:Holliday junction resolvase RusA-like endonuclease
MPKRMTHTVTIPMAPRAKGRPRVTRAGRTYTPQTTRDAEAKIAAAWDGPKFDGPVDVTITFAVNEIMITVRSHKTEHKSRVRGDIDNLCKTVLDGLNTVAWDDDRQVVVLQASKENEAYDQDA